MKKFRKILSVFLVVALVSSLNWGYFTHLLALTNSAAIECVTGGDAAGAALAAELRDISVSKFFDFSVSDDVDTSEDILFDSTEEETTEDLSKSGKDLIKNISKIEYGSDELSQTAIEYRKAQKITSAGRNVCVVEYKNADGTIMREVFVSNENKHSEELMIDFLMKNNILGENVIKIFSEREPCVETSTNIGHNCSKHIMEYMPDAQVVYAVDYGLTREDGENARRILKGILSELLK